MKGYQNPSTSQRTNISVNSLLQTKLSTDNWIEFFALPDHGLLFYGGFILILPLGLKIVLLNN